MLAIIKTLGVCREKKNDENSNAIVCAKATCVRVMGAVGMADICLIFVFD